MCAAPDGLALIVEIERIAHVDLALEDPENAHPAHVGIDVDLEQQRYRILVLVGLQRDRLAVQRARRRIALARRRRKLVHCVEQLVDAGPRDGGDETHGNQVAAAQRAFEGAVKLLRVHVLALFQVQLHEVVVEFHDLIDDGGVRRRDRIEVGVRVFGIEIAVGDPRGAVGGQVQRNALAAEGLADLRHEPGQVGGFAVDMADHDEPGHVHFPGGVHGAPGHEFDAGRGVDHDHRGFGRRQHAQRASREIGGAGRVDQVDVSAAVLEMAHRHVGGILQALLFRAVVANGAAALDAAGRRDCAGCRQQVFGQHGLAGAGMTEENDVADGSGGWMGHARQTSVVFVPAGQVAWRVSGSGVTGSGASGAVSSGCGSGSGCGGLSRISLRLARPCSYAEPTMPSIISPT